MGRSLEHENGERDAMSKSMEDRTRVEGAKRTKKEETDTKRCNEQSARIIVAERREGEQRR